MGLFFVHKPPSSQNIILDFTARVLFLSLSLSGKLLLFMWVNSQRQLDCVRISFLQLCSWREGMEGWGRGQTQSLQAHFLPVSPSHFPSVFLNSTPSEINHIRGSQMFLGVMTMMARCLKSRLAVKIKVAFLSFKTLL